MLTKKAVVQQKHTAAKKGIWRAVKKDFSNCKYLYLMALPVIAFYIIFHYLPIYGVSIAFKQYSIADGIFGSPWVGFKYFKEFFSSIYFERVMKNTLIISFYDLLVGFPMPIIFALLMNELRNVRFKKTVQTITYLPHFISMVVICGIIQDFFSSSGVVTSLIAFFGGPRINYVGSNDSFRHINVWTNLWQAIGWNSIVYLAALTGVDQQLYEAATIDGAGKFKQVIHVTIPGIASTVIVMLIMKIGKVLSVGHEKIILLYSPATYETADIISSFVYRRGLGENMQYSYSAAVGLFQSVVNLILILTANKLSKKFTDMGLF
ncbi:MAG: sugar ABC transporter permease [Ruminococcus sp.]|nr:sugar ABC transporter permease [Ruminococcus sp.]